VPIFSPRKNVRSITAFALHFTIKRPQNHHTETPLFSKTQEKHAFCHNKKIAQKSGRLKAGRPF
jgi:hypothetical protein